MATTQNPPAPIKAFLQHSGSQVLTTTPADGYPFQCTDDEMAQRWFRQRRYAISCSYKFEGIDGNGDSWVYEGDFGGNAENGDGTRLTTERELLSVFTFGAQGGWSPPGNQFLGNRKITINGVVITDDPSFPYDFRMRHGSIVDQQDVSCARYFYGIEDQLWLPNLFLQIGEPSGSGDLSGNCLGTPVILPGFHLLTTSAIFNSQPIGYSIAIFDFLSITDFSLVAEVNEWWEYRKSDATSPIWDSATGARLRTPITQIF